MESMKRFLWKYFGVTLDRETRTFLGIVLASFLFVIVFGVLFVVTHGSFFLLLAILGLGAGGIVLLGNSNNAFSWMLANKEERRRIEEEIALQQLRRRARDGHYEH